MVENVATDIIEKRVEEIESEVLEKNKEYRKITERYNILFNKIRELLPKGHNLLIVELDREINCQQNIVEEVYYLQGIKDAAELKDSLNKNII